MYCVQHHFPKIRIFELKNRPTQPSLSREPHPRFAAKLSADPSFQLNAFKHDPDFLSFSSSSHFSFHHAIWHHVASPSAVDLNTVRHERTPHWRKQRQQLFSDSKMFQQDVLPYVMTWSSKIRLFQFWNTYSFFRSSQQDLDQQMVDEKVISLVTVILPTSGKMSSAIVFLFLRRRSYSSIDLESILQTFCQSLMSSRSRRDHHHLSKIRRSFCMYYLWKTWSLSWSSASVRRPCRFLIVHDIRTHCDHS